MVKSAETSTTKRSAVDDCQHEVAVRRIETVTHYGTRPTRSVSLVHLSDQGSFKAFCPVIFKPDLNQVGKLLNTVLFHSRESFQIRRLTACEYKEGGIVADDDVSGEGIDALQNDSALVGWLPFSPGLLGAPNPVFDPSKSTPLDEDDDANAQIPPAALWAMKYRRHLHFGSRGEEFFRTRLGDDGDPIYVLDDGPKHCMICRETGVDDEGLTYYLIGRITVGVYERFADDDVDVAGIFSEGNNLCLCSVYEATEGASNVLLVESYRGIDDVPADYLPSNPLIQFSNDLPDES